MFFWREWWPERKMELGISRNKAIFSLLVLMLQCYRCSSSSFHGGSWSGSTNLMRPSSISSLLGAMSYCGAQARGGFLWLALVAMGGGGLVSFSLEQEDGGETRLRSLESSLPRD
jgi:hypothetical protein